MSRANRAAHDDVGIQRDLANNQLRFRSLVGARVVDLGTSMACDQSICAVPG
jgi:hypothetical protein